MVKQINIGVLSIQGAVSEHIRITKKALNDINISGNVSAVKSLKDLDNINGLIIPGGESTTISKFLNKSNLSEKIINKAKNKELAVMGTCAGCIILAKKIIDKKKDVKTLELMDISVIRNAYGRQKQSFEKKISIKGFENEFNAVFIRAPLIKQASGNTEIYSRLDNDIIMVKQDNLIATTFHPELTNSTMVHKFFIEMIKGY